MVIGQLGLTLTKSKSNGNAGPEDIQFWTIARRSMAVVLVVGYGVVIDERKVGVFGLLWQRK